MKKVINVKVDEDLYWELKKILIIEKLSMKEGVIKAITNYIKSVKKN